MIQPAVIQPFAHLQIAPVNDEQKAELMLQLLDHGYAGIDALEGLEEPVKRVQVMDDLGLGDYFGDEAEEQKEEVKEEAKEPERQNIAQMNIGELVPQFEGKRTCAKCVKNAGNKFCNVHGSDYIDHKCIYCCAPALYNCGGEYYFCAYHHHDGKYQPDYEEKKRGKGGDCGGDVSKCDLGIPHIPNLPYNGNIFPPGDLKVVGFALGCSICREKKFGLSKEEL